MSDCKHEFIAVDKPNRYTFWMCKHCEMELPRDHYEALQQARREADESAKDAFRRGWEQAKVESEGIADTYFRASQINGHRSEIARKITKAIAAMEYKGESK